MLRCAFTPYEGKKPYIFVSYAHKDSDRVFPILEELDRRGYRVWYDDGIAPGSEWPENIAQHLDGCSVTLAFISPNSIASANCRREVTFALSKRKPFLGIVLQPTEMSLGMEMQLSAQQCIMKYTYASEDDFLRKLCSCPDLQPCLGQPKAAPVVPPAAAPTPAPKPQPEKKPIDKKLIGILAGAAAAVVVLAVALILVLGGGSDEGDKNLDTQLPQNTGSSTTASKPEDTKPEDTKPEDTEPEDTEPEDTEPEDTEPEEIISEEYLYYKDQVITATDVEYISQQTGLVELEMYNCVIQGNAFRNLVLADTLAVLVLENCDGVSNLLSLENAEGLMNLKIVNCGITDADMPNLKSKELCEATISGNPAFTNLDIFAQCTALEHLDFSGTAVASLEAVAGMEDLYYIYGNDTQVADLTPVTNLTNLTEVHFANCAIEAIDNPFYSLYLEVLDLSGNMLTDADALTYCTTLRVVDLSYNDLMYPEKLGKSAESLEELNLSGNPHLYNFRLDFLETCTALEKLSLDGVDMDDLGLIQSLSQLKYLSLVNCSISSLENLRGMHELEYLNLSANAFSDISPLAEIASYVSLRLDLSYNSYLTDVSALPELHYAVLNLTGSAVDPYTIPPLFGEIMIVGFDEAWRDPNCMNEADRSSFGRIAIVDCPLDQVVALRERFGEDRLLVLNEVEDYLQKLEEEGIDCSYLRKYLQQ